MAKHFFIVTLSESFNMEHGERGWDKAGSRTLGQNQAKGLYCSIHSTAVHRGVLQSSPHITVHRCCNMYGWKAAHTLIPCRIRLQRSWVGGCCIFHVIHLEFLIQYFHIFIFFLDSFCPIRQLRELIRLPPRRGKNWNKRNGVPASKVGSMAPAAQVNSFNAFVCQSVGVKDAGRNERWKLESIQQLSSLAGFMNGFA